MRFLGLGKITLRKPIIADAAAMRDIVDRTENLDSNSMYNYLLMCRDFGETSIVSCHCDAPVGFVTAYRRPRATADLFVWQAAVDPEVTAPGLGVHMLDTLMDRMVATGITHLETTISPENRAVRAMLHRFANKRNARIESSTLLETEIRYRIGPLG
jgi:L-2,4-diaminobutyric acid acetyltransferase